MRCQVRLTNQQSTPSDYFCFQHHTLDTAERVELSDQRHGSNVRKQDQRGCHPTTTLSRSRMLPVHPANPQLDYRVSSTTWCHHSMQPPSRTDSEGDCSGCQKLWYARFA